MTDLASNYKIHVGPEGRVELECWPEPRFAFLLTPSQARRLGTKLWKATGPWSESDWRTMVLALRKIRDAQPSLGGSGVPLRSAD